MDTFLNELSTLPTQPEENVFNSIWKQYERVILESILSAFLFGASHLNMCQFVHSGVGGLMLGFVYYKTNNVFATIIIHAIHNSWVTFLGLIMEGLEYTPDSSDKGLVVKLISVSLMVAFASVSILIMKRFISRYPQPQFVENEEPDEPVMEEY